MLYRVVRPVRRQGSSNQQFVKRIPADVLGRIDGLKLAIPLGADTIHRQLKAGMQAVRYSLRTNDPREVKARNQAVDEYFGTVWQALRSGEPQRLTHRQAIALAGEAYRAWADPDRGERVTAIEVERDGTWRPATVSSGEDAAHWSAAAERLAGLLGDDADPEGVRPVLEHTFSPIVDRLLAGKGIVEVDQHSRTTILQATGAALRDAFRQRQAYARGDYSPDTTLSRFPRGRRRKARKPALPRRRPPPPSSGRCWRSGGRRPRPRAAG